MTPDIFPPLFPQRVARGTQPKARTGVKLSPWGAVNVFALTPSIAARGRRQRRGSGMAEFRWVFERVCVFIVFPAILIFGIRCEVPSQLTKLATWMGESSFPIYAIHLPLISLWATALAAVGASYLRMAPVFMTICIGCSLLFSRMFDAPVRKWMDRTINRYLRPRSTYRARQVPCHIGDKFPKHMAGALDAAGAVPAAAGGDQAPYHPAA
jgi:peptidoglycan/LPS O-acetylase OafA/YrhL